jgi:hypothetical protein
VAHRLAWPIGLPTTLLILSFYRAVGLKSAPIIKARSSSILFIIGVLFLLLT